MYVIDDDFSGQCLDEGSNMASNTSSFSFVMSIAGFLSLAGRNTLPETLAALGLDDVASSAYEPRDEFAHLADDAIEASLERTLTNSGHG